MSDTDKEQPKLQNFIPGWLPFVATERLIIAKAEAEGRSTAEIERLVREYARRIADPVLVDIGDEEETN